MIRVPMILMIFILYNLDSVNSVKDNQHAFMFSVTYFGGQEWLTLFPTNALLAVHAKRSARLELSARAIRFTRSIPIHALTVGHVWKSARMVLSVQNNRSI
jgi:hypothetical protein